MTSHRDQWFGGRTYAQHGDDLAVLNIFKRLGIEKPSYLDVGAYHPFDLSNTALLYERGSRGIVVEPNMALGNAINRLNHEMAVILGCENMLLGSGGQAGGSRALSSDKSEHMYLVVNSVLGDIAEGMDRDMLGPLWLMNGLDESLKPSLDAEDVQFKDVGEITTALQQMAQAGAVLSPDDPAIEDVRSLLGISAPLPVDPALMGVRPRQPVAKPPVDLPVKQTAKRRK